MIRKLWPYKYFLIPYLVLLLSGVLLLLISEQGDLIFWWSGMRSDFWTMIFLFANELGEEWGYIFIGLYFLFVIPYRALAIALDGLLVTIVVQLLKFIFAQPRPIKILGDDLHLTNPVEGWHVVSGINSFPSGHTAGAFALVSLLSLYAKGRGALQIILVFMAAMCGMARIYSVNHFLEDVLLGSFVGVVVGYAVGWSTETYLPEQWKNFRIFRKTE